MIAWKEKSCHLFSIFFFGVCGLQLIVPCFAGYDAILDLDKFPSPITDFKKCGRAQQSFICDPEAYINPKCQFDMHSFTQCPTITHNFKLVFFLFYFANYPCTIDTSY